MKAFSDGVSTGKGSVGGHSKPGGFSSGIISGQNAREVSRKNKTFSDTVKYSESDKFAYSRWSVHGRTYYGFPGLQKLTGQKGNATASIVIQRIRNTHSVSDEQIAEAVRKAVLKETMEKVDLKIVKTLTGGRATAQYDNLIKAMSNI